MFFVSTVLGEKSSDVEQSRVASTKLPGRRPPPHWTVRGPVKEGVMFGELSVLQLLFFVEECAWMFGNRCVSECLEDAFFFMQTLDRGETWRAAENVGVCVEHIYKCFLSVLS